jgi:uncharacterized protein YndB with AHSA1/START domain
MLVLQMEIPIAAPAHRVWWALTTQVGLWWPRAVLVSGEAMQFEPTLGGRLFGAESCGTGVIWYTVDAIVPGTSIDPVGQLSPAFGGPAQSLLRLELIHQRHLTVLALTDAAVGNIGADSADALGEGWRSIFDAGLRAFVESPVSEAARP